MPGGIDEVQLIFLSVLVNIRQVHRLALDRNAAFALDVHIIEDLVAELPVVDELRILDKTVGECRLSVVNMGYNAKISYVFHKVNWLYALSFHYLNIDFAAEDVGQFLVEVLHVIFFFGFYDEFAVVEHL